MILKGMPWLQKQLKKLEETNSKFKEEIKKVKEVMPEVFNEFNQWTPLKLTFLNFTLDVCAIVANKKYVHKNYIDLFAGSGINKMRGKHSDFLIGSPLISILNHHGKFTNFFFCEENPTFFNALEKRIGLLGFKSVFFLKDNCNFCLNKILEEIAKNEKSYNFFFISLPAERKLHT